MRKSELKAKIIQGIAKIEDVSFLEALSTIIESGIPTDVIQLTEEQIKEIVASKRDIEQGLNIENNLLEKEVKQWLKRR